MTEDRDMDDREGLAAEYVLGTLPLPERTEAERMIARDPAFATLVQKWEAHFAALNDGFAETAPPAGLLEKTEARLFPAPRPRPSRLRFWLGGLAGAALAAAVAFVLLPPVPPTAPAVTATLQGEGQDLVVVASFDPAAGQLTVNRTAGPAAPAGRDYQLWLIPAGASPVPMGLLRDGALEVVLADLPPGTTLAVSDEPRGGSPTGQPTGAVLVATVIEG